MLEVFRKWASYQISKSPVYLKRKTGTGDRAVWIGSVGDCGLRAPCVTLFAGSWHGLDCLVTFAVPPCGPCAPRPDGNRTGNIHTHMHSHTHAYMHPCTHTHAHKHHMHTYTWMLTYRHSSAIDRKDKEKDEKEGTRQIDSLPTKLYKTRWLNAADLGGGGGGFGKQGFILKRALDR